MIFLYYSNSRVFELPIVNCNVKEMLNLTRHQNENNSMKFKLYIYNYIYCFFSKISTYYLIIVME